MDTPPFGAHTLLHLCPGLTLHSALYASQPFILPMSTHTEPTCKKCWVNVGKIDLAVSGVGATHGAEAPAAPLKAAHASMSPPAYLWVLLTHDRASAHHGGHAAEGAKRHGLVGGGVLGVNQLLHTIHVTGIESEDNFAFLKLMGGELATSAQPTQTPVCVLSQWHAGACSCALIRPPRVAVGTPQHSMCPAKQAARATPHLAVSQQGAANLRAVKHGRGTDVRNPHIDVSTCPRYLAAEPVTVAAQITQV